MYTLSFKSPNKKTIIVFLLALVLAILFFCFFIFIKQKKDFIEYSNRKYNVWAKTNEDRIKFLSQFKWDVEEEPVDVTDIKIPTEFNNTYKQYNEIQKKQGLDLSKYKGKVCKSFVYRLKNDYNKCATKATIIVYNDKVIGGDISSAEYNGFIKSFFGN